MHLPFLDSAVQLAQDEPREVSVVKGDVVLFIGVKRHIENPLNKDL